MVADNGNGGGDVSFANAVACSDCRLGASVPAVACWDCGAGSPTHAVACDSCGAGAADHASAAVTSVGDCGSILPRRAELTPAHSSGLIAGSATNTSLAARALRRRLLFLVMRGVL